jgi:hypothetical protein
MTAYTLLDIPFTIDLPALLKQAHINENSPMAADFTAMAAQAQAAARPKVLYRVSLAEPAGDQAVVVDGVRFTSRVLRVNLADAHRVFPFLGTCGAEMAAWAAAYDDLLESFWAGLMMEQALYAALQFFEAHIEKLYQPGTMASMNPGSLEDWPLSEQAPMFALLGDTRQQIGVRLTDSMLMVPAKSVSGILFPAEESYANCQLCPREVCPNRRAPYDEMLYIRKYQQQ